MDNALNRPNDRRGFIHKKLLERIGFGLGGRKGVLAIGAQLPGFIGQTSRQLQQRYGPGQVVSSQPVSFADARRAAEASKIPCGEGQVRYRDGHCHNRFVGAFKHPGESYEQGALPFGKEFRDFEPGLAVMGRYGPALEPATMAREVRECLPGMVLGKDGLCYNRRDISNSEREHPRGTRPLGTPGEMACLRKASSFGRRMERTVKRMRSIGVLKQAPRSRKPPQAARPRAGTGTSIINVD